MNEQKRLIPAVTGQHWNSLCTFHLRRLWGQKLAGRSPNLPHLPGTELKFPAFLAVMCRHRESWVLGPGVWVEVMFAPLHVQSSLLLLCFPAWYKCAQWPHSLSIEDGGTTERKGPGLLRGKIPTALIHHFGLYMTKKWASIRFWPVIHFGGIHITLTNTATEAPYLDSSFYLNKDVRVFSILKALKQILSLRYSDYIAPKTHSLHIYSWC